MSKQIAVEWLAEIFKRQQFITASQIIEAKEIERQNIIDAYFKAQFDCDFIGKNEAEQYYNETFRKP